MGALMHINRFKIKIGIPLVKYRPLPVDYEKQCYDNWCWAACGTMYINYILKKSGFSENIEQCDFAKKHETLRHVEGSLCTPKNNKFDITLHYTKVRPTILQGFDIATGFQHKIFFKENHHHPKGLNKIINQDKKPVLASLERSPGSEGGHLVVIYGFNVGRNELNIFDPDRGTRTINYNKFAEDYFNNNGQWRYSWT